MRSGNSLFLPAPSMLQIKYLLLSCGLLLVLSCLQSTADTTIRSDPGNDTCESGNGSRTDDLCENFQFIRDLIDIETLENLTLAHYQCNSKFRKAVLYYNSSRFQLVIEQLQQSEAFQRLLEELRDAGVDTTAINQIIDIFACFAVPFPSYVSPNRTCDCRSLRGHTFLGDLLAILPRQRVHDYTTNARVYGTNFGLFSDALTSSQFQDRLRSTLVSV